MEQNKQRALGYDNMYLKDAVNIWNNLLPPYLQGISFMRQKFVPPKYL
jgi:hypothetical protein